MFRYLKPLLNPGFTTFKVSSRNTTGRSGSFTPRRACLYVPGNDLDKIQKSFTLDVDCIVLDCEDGVAVTKKEEARKNIRNLLDKGKPGKPQKKRKYDFAVRINGLQSGIIKEDLKVLVAGKNLPDTIFLPKVESYDDLIVFSEYLGLYMKPEKRINLVVMVESANSLINLVDICRKAKQMSQSHKCTPVGLLFGSDDYCASIGAQRTESCYEIIYARQKIVAVAKAFNLQAIDMVYVKYQDLEGLKRQAKEGADFGYSGKQIIHPGQIDIVQQTFMPTQEQIEWASAVIKAFHKHQKEGKGAFTYKDEMIDMPTMRQAQHIMNIINSLLMQE